MAELPLPTDPTADSVNIDGQSVSLDVSPVDVDQTNPVTATDSGTGAANAATLTLGNYRQSANIIVDTSGTATLTVEIYVDGVWETFYETTYDSAVGMAEIFPHVASDQIRAYLDQNRNDVTIIAKGV